MKREYEDWLQRQGYDSGTINAQLHRAGRVEVYCGDLDQHFIRDGCEALIAELTYSTEDRRRGRPNPSKIPFVGDIRNNLATYKTAVVWYRRFREAEYSPSDGSGSGVTASGAPRSSAPIRMARAATLRPVIPPRAGARTLVDFNLDGREALAAIIAASQYGTISQAVASLTLFSHPVTVAQTRGTAIFPTIRNQRRVGQIDEHEGRRILLDDNKSPTDAFLWANGLRRRGADVQFNHVYAASLDVDAYTALPNICMTPAFLAKLTDTSDEVRRLLEYRCYQLYGWVPKGKEAPQRPPAYEILEWAAPLPPVEDVRAVMEATMARKPKDRTVMAAREIGWLFA